MDGWMDRVCGGLGRGGERSDRKERREEERIGRCRVGD